MAKVFLRHWIIISYAILPAGLYLTGGCGQSQAKYLTPQRFDRGLVIILPGIEGNSPLNQDIRRGLEVAGIDSAISIYQWGRPIPIAGPLINQMDILGNRLEARRIAQVVESYQDTYPGRSVYIIGHSGGGGMAVFAAEALHEDHKIDGLVLLSTSISSGYDLSKAMEKCNKGIVNFFSPSDFGLLVIGTTLAGNVDGVRGPAAGAYGFDMPDFKRQPQKINTYRKLYQYGLDPQQAGGLIGAHASTTRWSFVSRNVVPWITTKRWPPSASYHLAQFQAANPPDAQQTASEPNPLVNSQDQP